MLITISGPPGSGKSTNAARLAAEFGFDHVSGGDTFREMATERGLSPVELNERAEEDEQIDRDLDRRLRETAVEGAELVLESRLAGWLAGDHADIRVWLDAPLDVRVERIVDREQKEFVVAREETRRREESEAKRYLEYYNIDIHDRSIYDVVINTGRWSEDAVTDMLVAAVEAYDPDADEGQTPVDGVDYDF